MDFFGFHQAIENTLQFAALREVYCAAAGTIILSTFSVTQGMLFLHTNTTFELFILIIQSVQSKLTYIATFMHFSDVLVHVDVKVIFKNQIVIKAIVFSQFSRKEFIKFLHSI